MAEDGIEVGMTDDQVRKLVEISVRTMADRMARSGNVRRAPWGLSYDPKALEKTVQAGLLLSLSGIGQIDKRAFHEDLSDEETMKMLMNLVNGYLTMAAASILYLRSCPIPFDLIKHLQATERVETGRMTE